jgi:hypothetical protein
VGLSGRGEGDGALHCHWRSVGGVGRRRRRRRSREGGGGGGRATRSFYFRLSKLKFIFATIVPLVLGPVRFYPTKI